MAGSAAAVPAGAGAVDLTDLDMWARGVPYDEFARLRREAPVAWHDEASPNSGFWSVHCYQDILTASRDVAMFSSASGISFEEPTDEVCLGAHLARLDVRVVLAALARRVIRFELAGPPRRVRSDFTNGLRQLPVRVRMA
jgi:cytochrome P450